MPWIGGILMVYHGTNFSKSLLIRATVGVPESIIFIS